MMHLVICVLIWPPSRFDPSRISSFHSPSALLTSLLSWTLFSLDPPPAPTPVRPFPPTLLCSDLCLPKLALIFPLHYRLPRTRNLLRFSNYVGCASAAELHIQRQILTLGITKRLVAVDHSLCACFYGLGVVSRLLHIGRPGLVALRCGSVAVSACHRRSVAVGWSPWVGHYRLIAVGRSLGVSRYAWEKIFMGNVGSRRKLKSPSAAIYFWVTVGSEYPEPKSVDIRR